MNKNDYLTKVYRILSDRTKFKIINENVHKTILHVEDKINRFISKLKKLNLISVDVYNSLFVSGSTPGILYGLPKTHKNGNPIRPIFSAIGTPAYKISKFFVPILNKLTTNLYTINNSFSFVDYLSKISNVDNLFMVSFDVESLFTNIPLQETIDICISEMFHNTNMVSGLNKENFKKLLEMAVLNSYFIFNEKFYVQHEGVGMGLPLGPTFANIFMCHHEKNWLMNCPTEFRPIVYKRYVDDCFAIFNNKQEADKFLEFLNKQHKNIKFTIECENNKKLPFLDILIERASNKFQTSVYRKSTFTGLGSSFFNFTPIIFKYSAIKTLIFRAFNISSNYQNFHLELEFLKNFFTNNGYPITVFYKIVNEFLNKTFNYNNKNSNIFEVPKLELYFKFPFFGTQSDKLKTELTNVLNKYFPYIKPKFIFINNFKTGNFFKFKDELPKDCVSGVVYKFCCPLCGGFYIGSTIKTLKCRVSQHNGTSCRTGLPVKASHSSIRDHTIRSCNTNIDISKFKILIRNNNESALRLLESILIYKEKPGINTNDTAVPLLILC